ncbi:interferon-induced protein 44-like [Salminus brasiliensis]|uniref:interferon-induced protein 44-like n=1 Tax=Salminus brasiliensis TaxID=930266 RepID=UPI003B82E7AA
MGKNWKFVTVLADKQVKEEEDVTLRCQTNTGDVTVTWEKKDQKLCCVEGKHRTGKEGSAIFLEIKKVELGDEGKYTALAHNDSLWGRAGQGWLGQNMHGLRQDPIISALKSFKISSGDVKELRFLLHGPVGAGKSSIINTIKTIFEGHQYINCLTGSALTGESLTTKFEKFNVGDVPFTFYDVMGLEKGGSKGVHPDDIISALKGHVPNNYEFKACAPIDKDNRHYILDPTLNDKIHCLVSVIPADTISRMDDEVIQKMRNIRVAASELRIPQVVFLTTVDQSCPMTKKDMTKLYQSRKIKQKVDECRNKLGVAPNCIFPVKNYHEETKPNEQLNCLMLEAFTQIVHSADDFVKRNSSQQETVE